MVHSRLYGKSRAPDLTNGEYTVTLRNGSILSRPGFMIAGSLRPYSAISAR